MDGRKRPPRGYVDRFETTDRPPSSEEDVRAERRSIRAMLPWWRRFVAWVTDFHKFVTALVGISLFTIGVHVWLKGLITRKELEVAVEASVEKVLTKNLLDVKVDITTLKDNTAGLPAWRGEAIKQLERHDTRIGIVEHKEENLEGRFDKFILRRN